jgi:hypothetical protein
LAGDVLEDRAEVEGRLAWVWPGAAAVVEPADELDLTFGELHAGDIAVAE